MANVRRFKCGLTFELRGRRRQGALAARRMIDSERLAAKVPCRWRSASSEGLGVTSPGKDVAQQNGKTLRRMRALLAQDPPETCAEEEEKRDDEPNGQLWEPWILKGEHRADDIAKDGADRRPKYEPEKRECYGDLRYELG